MEKFVYNDDVKMNRNIYKKIVIFIEKRKKEK